MRRIAFAAAILLAFISSRLLLAQNAPTPRVEITPAPTIRLSGDADSNSPALWQRVSGQQQFFVMTSTAGRPSTASGPQLRRLGEAQQISMEPWPGGGVWMEAVVAGEDGTWYGYYHNENIAAFCGTPYKVIPRIGAARSRDRGASWQPLGVVLEAPPASFDCITNNHYFVGGVGDFSVQLDAESRDLYFFFSQYLRAERLQGVGVARLAWADRDNPAGKAMVWAERAWYPARLAAFPGGATRWIFPSALPIFPAAESWHDNDMAVDAFWGPAVHWNTYLEQYVMLLNHARDAEWSQEGVYVSFAPRLDDPRLWSPPLRIFQGGSWYPQVIGIEEGTGTDKVAGRWARFFMGGSSSHLIQFIK